MTQAVDRLGQAELQQLRRYPRYQASGVDWLGEIPAHWKPRALKREFRVVNGSTPKTNEPENWDGDIPWITPDDLGKANETERVIAEPARYLSDRGYERCGTQLVEAGSLILSTRAPIGHLAIVGAPVCTNQGCRSLVPRRSFDETYFYFLLRAARPVLEAAGRGSTFKELAKEDLESVVLPVPPPDEQNDIAAFLDRETIKIDALVAKKERLVELLQEKRAALITRAVSRGLDPSAPTKDSCVEWLGRIPSRWEAKRLRHIVRNVEQGWSPQCENRQAGLDEWGVLKAGCVNRGRFLESEHKALPSSVCPVVGLEIMEGDLLMSRASGSRKLVGSVAIVPECRSRLLLSDKVFRLRIEPDASAPYFIAYAMNSHIVRWQIESALSGGHGLASNISQQAVRDLVIPHPPREEAKTVVAHLDRETAKIDAALDKTRAARDLLQELRTALISAAVTGKIDVREAAAQ